MDRCEFTIILLCVFVTIATGLDESRFARILKYEFSHDNPSSYYYQYENSDGQTKEEKGEHVGTADFTVRGSYSFLGADGITYTVHYVADKDGFHPTGDHINVPPYTPWPVNRVLADDADDGRYVPEAKYLPSTEKTPPQHPQPIVNDFANSVLTQTGRIAPQPSSTPQPPLPRVTNAYIPSTPNPPRNKYAADENRNAFSYGGVHPYGDYQGGPSNAYIPSTPSPSINAVTVSPLSHIGAASTPVPQHGRAGRGRNLAAHRRAQSDLFEVIQNNHSSQGVFKDD